MTGLKRKMCVFFCSLSVCLVLSQTRRWKSLSGIFTVRSPNLLWSVNVCRCTIGTEGGDQLHCKKTLLLGAPRPERGWWGAHRVGLGVVGGQMVKTGWLWGQGLSSRLFSH